MKKIAKDLISFGLATAMIFTVNNSVKASSNENCYVATNLFENIKMPEDSKISYTEEREDGTYYVSESVNGNNIKSVIYKIENGEKKFDSTIFSTVQEGRVLCTEKSVDGTSEKFIVLANDIDNLTQSDERIMAAGNKKYLRTEKYGISLVGKKITIAIAAGAIVAATPYVSLSVAMKIIVAAIAGGTGSGVASLPDYLYVTSKVYTTRSSGKIYTRYENKYYLNSARTKYIGSWTFSKRWGH